MRLFASHIRTGDYLDRRHDAAQPDRKPAPRPDIKMVQRPIGPVAVFGASNFPLAFSTAGGDTASALAAGCPVVVKGHSAHPGTAEIVAQAIETAILALGLHPGVFSLVQGGKRDVGEALVQHPLIKAVGFTGSLGGGRALFDLCTRRPEPILFFGELGSVNPMFLLPAATTARGEAIAKGWAGSLTMGAGQFCTNPGIAVVIDGPEAHAFITAAKAAVAGVGAQTMLTDGIAAAYRQGRDRVAAQSGVREVLTSVCDLRQATPDCSRCRATPGGNHALAEEVFGPLGLIVRVRDAAQMVAVAASLEGQLTCTLHLDDADIAQAQALMPTGAQGRAGSGEGFPTGSGGGCAGAWRALSGQHQFRGNFGRDAVDPALAAAGGVSEPSGCAVAGGFAVGLRRASSPVSSRAEVPGDGHADPGRDAGQDAAPERVDGDLLDRPVAERPCW